MVSQGATRSIIAQPQELLPEVAAVVAPFHNERAAAEVLRDIGKFIFPFDGERPALEVVSELFRLF